MLHPSTATFLLLSSALTAQAIAGEFTPNPVAPGQAVTFTLTDSTGQGRWLGVPCRAFTWHAGTQHGPVVDLGSNCTGIDVVVPPNGTAGTVWNQRDVSGRVVPPGRYWLEVKTWDVAQGIGSTDWFCVSIQTGEQPSLWAGSAPRLGSKVALKIGAPHHGGLAWFCALSPSSNNPVTVPGLQTCLSLPISASGIHNAFGVLDAGGNSRGIELAVPNVPALRFHGFHVQALLLGRDAPALTNDLSLTIR